MWFILGILAITFTISNIGLYVNKNDYTLAMALGLSFTALTLCAFNNRITQWVVKEDMSALLDVVPSLTPVLWILTLISIFLNLSPLFLEYRNKVKNNVD